MSDRGPPPADASRKDLLGGEAPDTFSAIAATGPDTLSNSFLGAPVEICIVTRSREKTMKALVELGVGPWRALSE